MFTNEGVAEGVARVEAGVEVRVGVVWGLVGETGVRKNTPAHCLLPASLTQAGAGLLILRR